jgi:chromatin remodeling complex protein RSC6
MARTAKATVVVDVPAASPVSSAVKAKVAPVKAAAAAAVAPAQPAPVAAAPTPAADEAPVVAANPFEEVTSKITAATTLLKELQGLLKTLSKEHEKMKKAVEKTERKRANARNNPNGFAKPSKIVDELCDFCGVPRGTKMSRTDVTRSINSYIKEKNLNKPENKRIIIPDEKLRTLLKLKVGDEVNYFKVQSFISPLFIKEVAAPVA